MTPITSLPSEIQRLIEIVETSMHVIARTDMTREVAIEVRQRFARPIGVLARRHSLKLPLDEPSETLVNQVIEETRLTSLPVPV